MVTGLLKNNIPSLAKVYGSWWKLNYVRMLWNYFESRDKNSPSLFQWKDF